MTEAERLVKAGVKELLVISQDTSAYGLDIKYAESAWKGQPAQGALPRPMRGAGLARRLGAPALRLSLSARRRRDAADGGGQDPSLPRHPLPARLATRAQGDAPPGAPGEDAGAHRAAGATSVPTSPSARPSSSASPARPRRTSSSCSTGCARRELDARRLLQVRARRRRAGQRSRRRRARRGEGRALAPLHGGAAGGERELMAAHGRHAASTSSSTRWTRKARWAARSGMRRRSTARIPQRRGRSAPGDILPAQIVRADAYDLWAEASHAAAKA